MVCDSSELGKSRKLTWGSTRLVVRDWRLTIRVSGFREGMPPERVGQLFDGKESVGTPLFFVKSVQILEKNGDEPFVLHKE